MSKIVTLEKVVQEASGVLDKSENERFVQRCTMATDLTAQATVTLGLAKGWRFRCLPGNFIDLWAPAIWKPITYTLRSAALWRAIQNRGISLT